MVARLRGRPSPRPPGPSETEEEVSKSPKAASSSQQRVLVAVTVFSLLSAAGATGTLLYFTMGPGRLGSATEADAPSATTGPIVDLGPFVVNIGSVNDRRYLRVGLSLEFQTKDRAFTEANEHNRGTWLSGLKTHLKPMEAIFKDVVVTTVSAKTPAELGSSNGKDALKAELMGKLNLHLNEHMKGPTSVAGVYITDFVIQ